MNGFFPHQPPEPPEPEKPGPGRLIGMQAHGVTTGTDLNTKLLAIFGQHPQHLIQPHPTTTPLPT